MKISALASVSLLSLGFSLAASAKEFRLPLSEKGENADGNYSSLTIDKDRGGAVVYELVPATVEVAAVLKAKRCLDGARIDASVLERRSGYDDENRRPDVETVKLLVRKLDCVSP
jgi:hypothetical protein